MSTYYKPSNDNLDNFKDRIDNYEQQPDEKVWNDIEKQLNKKSFPFKTLSLVGMGIILFAVAYMIFVPNKRQNTALQNNNSEIAKQNTKLETLITNIITFENNITKKHVPTNNTTSIAQTESEPVIENTSEVQSLESTNEVKSVIDIEEEKTPILTQETKTLDKDTLYLPLANDAPAKKIDIPEEELPEASDLFIPNAFTPGEATNNVFKPESEKQISDFEMKIFSRGGMQVFSCKNINQGWNGYVKGSLAPSGVYVYIITYKDSKNKKHTQKGSLMLLR